MITILPNGYDYRELQRQLKTQQQLCHVGSRHDVEKTSEGRIHRNRKFPLSCPLPIAPQKHKQRVPQIQAHTLSLRTTKETPPAHTPSPDIGYRKQGLATLADHRDDEYHPRRQDRHPGRGHHPRRPPSNVPPLQPEREAGKPRRCRYREVLLLQSRMRAETSGEAI